MNILIQNANQNHLHYLIKTLLRSYRKSSNPFVFLIPSEIYYSKHKQLWLEVFERPNSIIKVACDPEQPDKVISFIVAEQLAPNRFCVHYLYTQDLWRKHGFVNELLKDCGIDKDTFIYYSHITKDTKWASEKYKLVYDPYIFFRNEVI